MSKPFTIQLPSHLELLMLSEAQKQNTTLEHLALKSLQKDYGLNQSTYPHLTPSLIDFFIAFREGMQTGQSTVQAPADEFTLPIAEGLKRDGILRDFQVNHQQLTLFLNPTLPKSTEIASLDEINLAELDPALAKIIKDLKHGDDNVRYQAIQNLAQWHEQQS
jgi:hypothetical protein